jgi:hypothetical protein
MNVYFRLQVKIRLSLVNTYDPGPTIHSLIPKSSMLRLMHVDLF